jgi:hypothetical protein
MKHTTYLSTNEKLKRSGIYSWGIPAYKSASGMVTCPGAKSCIVGCYAKNGRYAMPNVKLAQEKRLALSLTDSFVETIDAELKARKVNKLRVHDSGDFYSLEYLNKWIEIARLNPKTLFYAYTKMIPLLKMVSDFPGNFVIIKSFGGKWDDQIDPETDRHSKVFSTIDALKVAGYADVTELDERAFGDNPKIGLVYHGPKAKAWSA